MLDNTDSRRIESALRERNEALEAADRLKSAFVANMSYELRTPLTPILGFSEMLTGGYAGDLNGQQGEYMRVNVESADRLQRLIANILDLAISDAGWLEQTGRASCRGIACGDVKFRGRAVPVKKTQKIIAK